ncbi:MAG: dihydropyrimidinase, partial [Proteobacteria bacterium]|nr:dihydropyrimidinase [Burkholderiales bacterium]
MTDPGFDLTVRNGTCSTSSDTFRADIGIIDGRIAALAQALAPGRRDIDATDRWVLPGGVDSHTHLEQRSSTGVMCADDFRSGTISAAFGGTTTVMSFAAQHRGDSLRAVVDDYAARAAGKAVVDYAFHLIVSDPRPEVLDVELPQLIAEGIRSFKVYMTYDKLKLDDFQLLEVLAIAQRERAMVMVHAENHEVIQWIARRLLERGHRAPKFHAVAHSPIAEGEATHRAIALSTVLEQPMVIVHVSDPTAIDHIRAAQTRGIQVFGETCPQYLFLTAADLDRPGLDGAMWCCSPPPRDTAAQEAVWRGLANSTLQLYSSDHAPYRFDESGKLPKGAQTHFREMANGVPGIELRLPLLFSAGVMSGRMTVNEFVAVSSTNHARMYGLHPRKGTLAIGADADLALWDPQRRTTVDWSMLHDNVGYTPYAGRELLGWPVTVIRRGEVIVDRGALHAAPGSGERLRCDIPLPLRVARPTR